MECGLENRDQGGQIPSWEPHWSVSVFLALLMAAHKNIQVSAFQIVGLGTKRNNILVSQVGSVKPRVLETET